MLDRTAATRNVAGVLRVTYALAADGREVMCLAGDIDLVTGHVLELLIETLALSSRDVHVDLHEIDFMDVHGLDALNHAARDVRRFGKRLVVHRPNPAVWRIHELARCAPMFETDVSSIPRPAA